MLISRVLLVPRLPTLLVDEHRGHVTPMLQALREQAEWLHSQGPQAFVVLSARWDSDGPFHVDVGRRHRTLTDYSGFGVEVRYDCPGHPSLGRALVEAGEKAGVRVGAAERGVDSGVTVPLHFLAPRPSIPVVPLSLAQRSRSECRAWGRVIHDVLDARPERVAFLVGGLLSHASHAWNFRREVPEAQEFDEHVLRALGSGAWDDLCGDDEGRIERAQPEAGLRHLEVLRGFLSHGAAGHVRCYEGGFGVGAALVEFEARGAVPASVNAGAG